MKPKNNESNPEQEAVLTDQWINAETTEIERDIGNREADLRSKEAADRGSRVHHACQSLMEGGRVIFNPRYRLLFWI